MGREDDQDAPPGAMSRMRAANSLEGWPSERANGFQRQAARSRWMASPLERPSLPRRRGVGCMRAIFCIDPGESTGIAWGIVDEHAPSALEAVHDRLFAGSATIVGAPDDQIRPLYDLWAQFKREAVYNHFLAPERIDLVIEDFVLYPGEKPGRSTTAPERVAWGFEGYRRGRYDTYRKTKHYTEAIWQKSGAAHRFKQRAILTKADAWIVGKDHER